MKSLRNVSDIRFKSIRSRENDAKQIVDEIKKLNPKNIVLKKNREPLDSKTTDLLCQFFVENYSITHLNISSLFFNNTTNMTNIEAYNIFLKSFHANTTITQFNCSKNPLEAKTQETRDFLAALSTRPNLFSLNINKNTLFDSVQLIQSQSLTNLSVRQNYIDSYDVSSVLTYCPHLTALNLGENDLSRNLDKFSNGIHDMALAIRGSSLTSLDLDSCNLNLINSSNEINNNLPLAFLLNIVLTHHSLSKINLSFNSFKPMTMGYIFENARKNPVITHIDLSYNNHDFSKVLKTDDTNNFFTCINIKSINTWEHTSNHSNNLLFAFKTLVIPSTKLMTLNLGLNNISNDIINIYLAPWLLKNDTLTSLDLRNNPDITYIGISNIAEALKNNPHCVLNKLILRLCTKIKETDKFNFFPINVLPNKIKDWIGMGSEKIEKKISDRTSVCGLFKPIKSIARLDLSRCALKYNDMVELKNNTSLLRVNVRRNHTSFFQISLNQGRLLQNKVLLENWQGICLLICSMRANNQNLLKTFILTLIPFMLSYAQERQPLTIDLMKSSGSP